MSRQFDPTTVWPPFSVERLMVANSRTTVPAPTRTPVGTAGSNRMTCGSPPTMAYGWTATRSPRMAPDLTMAPAWMTHPSPSCAPGSTIAVGWMVGFIERNLKIGRAKRENDLRGARALFRRRPGRGRPGPARRLHALGEQVELRVLQQVVDLQDADHLERV